MKTTPLAVDRPLARDRQAGDGDAQAVGLVAESLGSRPPPPPAADGEARAGGADGKARQPVVGEHPLPGRLLGQLRRRGSRVERSVSWRASPPEPGTVAGAKARPSSQSSRRRSPNSSQAPAAASASSLSRPSSTRCASSRTPSNGPRRSRSSTTAFRSGLAERLRRTRARSAPHRPRARTSPRCD